jgi:hypothetical protein
MEKCLHQFDTVIFDDASLINETDCLSALRHGAERAILLANPDVSQSMFLLNTVQNKTLFARIGSFEDLKTPQPVEAVEEKKTPAGKRSSSKKRTPAASAPSASLPLKVVFIDLEASEEKAKKESYENEPEAMAVADYLTSLSDEFDAKSTAVMSPLRT